MMIEQCRYIRSYSATSDKMSAISDSFQGGAVVEEANKFTHRLAKMTQMPYNILKNTKAESLRLKLSQFRQKGLQIRPF